MSAEELEEFGGWGGWFEDNFGTGILKDSCIGEGGVCEVV